VLDFGESVKPRTLTTVSEDSVGKNIGHIGQYISRIVEDQETNPDRHQYLQGIADDPKLKKE
jgi:hypothetical protein